MRQYKTILVICLMAIGSFLATGKLLAQHPAHYGQYMFNGLVLNPAYAGHKGVLDMGLLNRTQWIGFAGAPRTATFSVHTPSRNLKNNFGFVFVNDRLGPRRNNLLNAIYSYRLFFGKFALGMGLQGGVKSMAIRFGDLGREDQGDPNLVNEIPSVLVPQAGVGFWLTHPNFYLGFSSPEIIRLRSNAYQLHYANALTFRHYFTTLGLMLNAGRDVKIKPSVLMKYTSAVPIQFDLNCNVIIKDFLVTGVSYRTNGAVLGMMEWYLNEQFRVGFSYEMNTSGLRPYQSGTAEISLGYSFGYKVKTPGLRYF